MHRRFECIVLVVLFVCFGVAFSIAQDTKPLINFRDTTWGMSKDQVIALHETAPEYNEDDTLGWTSSVAGKDCFIFYIFAENKLARAAYMFNEQHSNRNNYINDYNEIKQLLQDKYGAPSDDKKI